MFRPLWTLFNFLPNTKRDKSFRVEKSLESWGIGCGPVGRADTSDTRGRSLNHRQI